MPKPKHVEFTVQGETRLPLDMLRYDRCWPKSQGDVTVLNLSHSMSLHVPRSVTLQGLKHPTVERWRSFGWEVVEVTFVNLEVQ